MPLPRRAMEVTDDERGPLSTRAPRAAGPLRVASLEVSIFLIWLLLKCVDLLLLPPLAFWRLARRRLRRRGQPRKVVVVGASFGGLAVQRELAGRGDLAVTLVDFKDYFEYTPGILRCFVNPDYLRHITCRLPSSRNARVIGEVIGASPNAVTVRKAGGSTESLSFDFLVLACGSTYQEPIKPVASEPSLEERQASWHRASERLQSADRVIIVGAGAVGVELAGEILTHHPGKRLTFVHMAPTILPGFGEECIEHSLAWLRRMGVELRLGEAIADMGTNSVTLQSGEVLRAGVVYKCVGVMPNTSMLKRSQFAESFGFRDSLVVNDHLQLEKHPNVFCVGDMMSHTSREMKLGHTAEVNAHLAAHNIIRLCKGDPLLDYPHGVVGARTTPKIYCLSLGRYDACLGFNRLALNGGLPALLKWLMEWTKVQAARERPVGLLFWAVADAVSNWLSRNLIKPS